MYCTKCGKKAAPGDRYCSGCGTRLRSEAEPRQRRMQFMRLGTLILAAAIVTVGAATVLRSRPEPAVVPGQPESFTTREETEQTTAAPETIPPSETQAAVLPPVQPAAPGEQKLYLAREAVDDNGMQQETLYRYDSQGRIARKQTPDGYTHFYSYRSDGTLEKEGVCIGEEPTTVILYDQYGNPERESDLMGNDITWRNRYDAQKRLLSSEKYSPEGMLLEKSSYTYLRDGGWIHTFSDYADGIQHCRKETTYDASGRILTLSQTLDSGMDVDILVENVYDIFGNPELTERSYEDSGLCTYHCTQYINTINGSGLLEAAEVYTEETRIIRGEVTSSPRALEKTVCYTYDDGRRLIRQETRGADDAWTYTITWEYDGAGNLLRSAEAEGGIFTTYEYLPLEQLLES